MKKEDLYCYEGKKIKILLTNKFCYTCTIKSIREDCIQVLDKFGNLVTISLKDIVMITEVNHGK